AHPDEEGARHRGRRHAGCEQSVEDEHVGDEEKISPGNEAATRQARGRPTEKGRRSQHDREVRRKEPGYVFDPALHAHLVAQRPQHVVAAQHEEEAGERPQRRGDLAAVDPDEAAQRGVREGQQRLDGDHSAHRIKWLPRKRAEGGGKKSHFSWHRSCSYWDARRTDSGCWVGPAIESDLVGPANIPRNNRQEKETAMSTRKVLT